MELHRFHRDQEFMSTFVIKERRATFTAKEAMGNKGVFTVGGAAIAGEGDLGLRHSAIESFIPQPM
jgi:hypothetical protein